jgi:hypothetical protein
MLKKLFRIRTLALSAMLSLATGQLLAQEGGPAPEFPPADKVLEGYEKVITKANITPMYTLWTRNKDGQMYAELPRTFAQKKYFIATTVASGEDYAGLQGGDLYVYWRRYDKHLALMAPQIEIRANGDKEAASSVGRLFTDRVLMEVPIVAMGPGGGPIIDVDQMLLNPDPRFNIGPAMFDPSLRMRGIFSIKTAKAFENNVEIAFEVPAMGDNVLKILHFSISDIPDNTGYQPRVADNRVGFFTTTYSDLAKYNDRETRVRYVNRWHLEKADPKLQLSPPKNPIVFYIEHTTPVRYRRWVRDGILAWNKAFEKVGISNAVEVYYQDAASGAHMDKDPEDVQYNFVRWLNNDVGTAIGPSRVHPLTGQILDADIILTDGWIRHYQKQFSESLPKIAMEGYGADTLAWLAEHPEWDPRVRLAAPSMRRTVQERIALQASKPYAGHPLANADARVLGDDEFDGLNRASQTNGMCLAAEGMSFDLALMKMTMDLLEADSRIASSQEGQKVTAEGKWSGVISGMKAANFPVDQVPFNFAISSDSGALKGSVSFANMEIPFETVTFDAATQELTATLKVENGAVGVTLTAKLLENSLTGSWEANANGQVLKGNFTATREGAPAPTPTPDSAPSVASAGKPADEPKPAEEKKDEKPAEQKKEEPKAPPGEQMLDGMPESFVGPLIAHLVAHEVGHTLGLRHNFKASSIFTLAEINSDAVKGKKQLAGSVMDYIGTNIRLDSGTAQGDYCMTGVGPYDMWAIEYGYTFGDLKPVLARVAEPELVFATDEDTGGPDPLARRYDFTKNPLDYAEEQMRLAANHRARLMKDFVKDGDSWDRVRYGYEMILGLQTRSLSMMANWVGGAHVNRDKKGDPNGRKPIEVVPADTQRKALAFVVNNAFKDESFGLSPELVTAMGLDKWSDDMSSMMEESTWPIHDRIMGIQASALTSIMNPTTLKRVYDNEFRVPADQDSLTLPEMLNTVTTGVWTELDAKAEGNYSARKPMISSLRRNLQREHLERLIDLTMPGSAQGAAGKTISTLASEQLRQIVKKIEAAQAAAADKHDPYTTAHLSQAKDRITKALDADYILNPSRAGAGGGTRMIFGSEEDAPKAP